MFSGQLLLGLAAAGMLREQAYRVVQTQAIEAWEQEDDFRAAIETDPDVRALLTLERIAQDFSVERYLRHVDAIFERVFGNIFMVFGEPDVDLNHLKDGTIQVTVRGVDVYDPTTQQIRGHSTDDIACWFIDTEYNGESFFVRHAYFTGADQPHEKLKRALKADVDEAAWSAIYSTTSRPFPKPKTGKIAV
ncbi:MAG: hypothetical protein Q8N47_26345 [Bryobacterales bacterium]|nr:hypothetical protein [Bryobacterales bacterium]